MFLFTLAGIVPAALLAWLSGSRSRSGIVLAAAFLVAMIVGLLPREIGRRVDPYDAYPSQFSATLERRRRSPGTPPAGLRLPAAADRRRTRLARLGRSIPGRAGHRVLSASAGGRWLAVLLVIALRGGGRPARGRRRHGTAIRPGGRSAAARLLVGILIVAAFLVNRNIFNSDNYRYLIFLLTPWSLGFGLVPGRPVSPRGPRPAGRAG